MLFRSVEHRFSITHETLDNLLKSKGLGPDGKKIDFIDLEAKPAKPESTQSFLTWAQDPKSFLDKTVVDVNPSANNDVESSGPPPPP